MIAHKWSWRIFCHLFGSARAADDNERNCVTLDIDNGPNDGYHSSENNEYFSSAPSATNTQTHFIHRRVWKVFCVIHFDTQYEF